MSDESRLDLMDLFRRDMAGIEPNRAWPDDDPHPAFKQRPTVFKYEHSMYLFKIGMAGRAQPSDCALTNEGAEPVAWRFRVSDSSDWFTTTRKNVAELFRKSADGSHSEPLYRRPPAPASVVLPRLQMSDVVKAHMDIPRCPVLTSNQCHALAMKLNACLDRGKELNS